MRPGQRIDERFLLVRLLETTRLNQVWLAMDGRRRVAVKVANPIGGVLPNARAVEALFTEVKVLGRLDHPNVPPLVAADPEGPIPYVAIDFVDGITLEREIGQRARRSDHFSLDDLAYVLETIAVTLEHAHARGVIHRDLKPANVTLRVCDERLSVYVLDFGVAKVIDDDEESTTEGRMIGTPLYLSPEQITSSGRASDRVDVFALAVIAFEMLTLRRLWLRGEDHLPLSAERPAPNTELNSKDRVLDRIANGPRPSVCELRPDLPPALDRVFARALDPEPHRRPASPLALCTELEHALRSEASDRSDSASRWAVPTKRTV
jgi:serine/threonine-protein kinase